MKEKKKVPSNNLASLSVHRRYIYSRSTLCSRIRIRFKEFQLILHSGYVPFGIVEERHRADISSPGEACAKTNSLALLIGRVFLHIFHVLNAIKFILFMVTTFMPCWTTAEADSERRHYQLVCACACIGCCGFWILFYYHLYYLYCTIYADYSSKQIYVYEYGSIIGAI